MFERFEVTTINARSNTYVIKGDPVPLARHRMYKGHAYDAQKHLKLVWGLELARQHDNQNMFEGPLHLECNFYMPMPKTTSKKRKGILVDAPHVSVPDLDNLIKFCADVATGILFSNDSQIASIMARKFYGELAQTTMCITELRKLEDYGKSSKL